MAEGSETNALSAEERQAGRRAGQQAEQQAERQAAKEQRARMRRLFWMKHGRIWHWISGAVTLVGMILFAVTGITLNHAADIEAKPKVEQAEAVLPPDLLMLLAPDAENAPADGETGVLPQPVADWLSTELKAPVSRRTGEWSDVDVYVGMPRPGGDAWLSVDRETGEVVFENTSRGAVSFLNDLHKGRNTGPVWFWFLDIFSLAVIMFCATGLILLWMHAPRRPVTWFIVGGGVVIPTVIAVFLLHV
jgi:hypothetical protein